MKGIILLLQTQYRVALSTAGSPVFHADELAESLLLPNVVSVCEQTGVSFECETIYQGSHCER